MKTHKLLPAIGLAALLLIFRPATAAEMRLHGHEPEITRTLKPAGRLPATNVLTLAIGLPLRNNAALDSLMQQIYDPASPRYRHYLTPAEFTERFGPTKQDYQ